MADSRWTFTVVAAELLEAGASSVCPFALVKTGSEANRLALKKHFDLHLFDLLIAGKINEKLSCIHATYNRASVTSQIR